MFRILLDIETLTAEEPNKVVQRCYAKVQKYSLEYELEKAMQSSIERYILYLSEWRREKKNIHMPFDWLIRRDPVRFGEKETKREFYSDGCDALPTELLPMCGS